MGRPAPAGPEKDADADDAASVASTSIASVLPALYGGALPPEVAAAVPGFDFEPSVLVPDVQAGGGCVLCVRLHTLHICSCSCCISGA